MQLSVVDESWKEKWVVVLAGRNMASWRNIRSCLLRVVELEMMISAVRPSGSFDPLNHSHPPCLEGDDLLIESLDKGFIKEAPRIGGEIISVEGKLGIKSIYSRVFFWFTEENYAMQEERG